MLLVREASLPRFRSKTHYEWFPTSVFRLLYPFLDWQSVGSGYIESSVLVLRLPSWPEETETKFYASLDWLWMDGSRNATVMSISIFQEYIWYAQINQQGGVGSLNSIASKLDALDSFACNADKTYSQPTCISCQQNWSTGTNIVASRMNYREQVRFR